MVRNSTDVGMDVNKLRSMPIGNIIHGMTADGSMTKEEIESVGFNYGDLEEMSTKYDISKLKDGFNDVDGERVFFVSNPALGLWAYRGRFED